MGAVWVLGIIAATRPCRAAWPTRYHTSLTVSDPAGTSPQLVPNALGGTFAVYGGFLGAQSLDPLGTPQWGPGERLGRFWSTSNVAACPVGEGGFYAVWNATRFSTETVWAQRLNPDGSRAWGLDGVVLESRPAFGFGQTEAVAIVPAAEDGAWVAWASFQFLENFTSNLEGCADGQGGAVFAWQAVQALPNTPGRRGEVWAQRVNSDGVPQWTAYRVRVAVHPEAGGDVRVASVSRDGFGGIVYLTQRTDPATQSEHRGVFANRTSLYGIHGDNGPTAVRTAFASVHADVDRVELRWLVGEDAARSATVERREPAGAWVALGVVRAVGPELVAYDDRTVTPGSRYAYRLAIRGTGGVTEHTAESEVSVPVSTGVGLRAVAPNPTSGAATIRFALAEPGEARLEVLDATGRRVAVLARGPHGAGEHAVVWNGRDDAGTRVPPGLYFARWAGAGRVETSRVVRVGE